MGPQEKTTTRTHLRGAEILCQFCATSLQNPATLRNIPEYVIPFIILILLSLFVAVYPCLPSTSVF